MSAVFQEVLKEVGGTVITEFLGGRPASCTFKLVGSNGTELQASAAATVDSVNTTASVAAAAGDLSATLTSVVGIAVDGRRYLFDGEDVTVKSVSGSVVTFWAPLMLNHAIGAAFQGCLVTATIDAASCDDEFWDARGIFTPASGPAQTEPVNCSTDIIPRNLIGLQDVRDANPNPQMSVSKELNIPRSLMVARDEAMLLIGLKQRASKHIGASAFRQVASLVWWKQRRTEYGENWGPELDKNDARLAELLAAVLGVAPQTNGDGTIPGPGGPLPADFNLAACG